MYYQQQQWRERFADRPEWLSQTSDVLLSCHVSIEEHKVYMPKFPLASRSNSRTAITRACNERVAATFTTPATTTCL